MLIDKSNEELDTLITNVCSKGGVTIAGLNKLYDNNFDLSIKECYSACVKRADELNAK
jgi:pyrroline-5-carboxylate reductase